jgi:hypothetical protein
MTAAFPCRFKWCQVVNYPRHSSLVLQTQNVGGTVSTLYTVGWRFNDSATYEPIRSCETRIARGHFDRLEIICDVNAGGPHTGQDELRVIVGQSDDPIPPPPTFRPEDLVTDGSAFNAMGGPVVLGKKYDPVSLGFIAAALKVGNHAEVVDSGTWTTSGAGGAYDLRDFKQIGLGLWNNAGGPVTNIAGEMQFAVAGYKPVTNFGAGLAVGAGGMYGLGAADTYSSPMLLRLNRTLGPCTSLDYILWGRA